MHIQEPYELQQGDGNLGIEERVAGYWRQKRNSTGCRAFEGLTFCLAHITSHDMPSREDVRYVTYLMDSIKSKQINIAWEKEKSLLRTYMQVNHPSWRRNPCAHAFQADHQYHATS